MRTTSTAFLAALALTTTLAMSGATAQEPPATQENQPSSAAPLSTAYTGRSITPPAGTFTLVAGPLSNLDLGALGIEETGLNQVVFRDVEFCVFETFCEQVEIADPLFALLGIAYAPAENIEVGALLLNLELAPDVEYLDPALWGRYRLLEGEIEIAVQAMIWFPVASVDTHIELGMPVRFRGPVRFDTGLYFGIDTGGDYIVRAPATLTANVTEEIFLGGRSGVMVTDNSDGLVFPLQFVGGYTVAGAGAPLADITLAIGFPYFIVTGGQDGYDELVTEIFQISLGANVFFDI